MTENAATPAPVKKRSIGKIILKLFMLGLILVIVGLVTLYFARNTLVRAGVIRAGKFATDQDTGLVEANLTFGDGRLQLSQFDINNPTGYKETKFLAMKDCQVTVDSSSLLTSTVIVDKIAITGLELTLEQNGMKNNLAEIMDIIKKKSPAANPGASDQNPGGGGTATSAPGKKLKINHIELAGTKVHIRGIFSMDLDLGPVTLEDPTNPDGRPMKIADVISKILIHVAQQIVENPAVPGNIKDSMKNVSALVDSLSKDLKKDLGKGFSGLGDATKQLQNATKGLQDLGKNIPDIGKGTPDAGKGLQDATKGLQNMFGGSKTTQPK